MTRSSDNFAQLLIVLVLLTVITSAIFLIFPQLDIFVAGLFADGENGFPLDQNTFLATLRFLFNAEITIICVTAVWMAIYGRLNGKIIMAPHQLWDMVLACFIAGPLVLANVIFKSFWGRPRPAHITEFGGSDSFIPPYYISDQCQSNCSFVSGEGSAIATAGILLGLITWTSFPNKRKRWIALIALISFVGIALRVVKGRHFVSDSLLATLFCAILVLLIYKLFGLAKVRHLITWGNIFHDIGCAIRFKREANKP